MRALLFATTLGAAQSLAVAQDQTISATRASLEAAGVPDHQCHTGKLSILRAENARVEQGNRHVPHAAHVGFSAVFSGYTRLRCLACEPRVGAHIRVRHLCGRPAA